VEPIQGQYVYFAGLTKNELPQGKEGDSYDVISWYLQWSGRNKEIKIIGHNVKGITPLRRQGVKVQFLDPLLPPTGAVEVLRFLLWGSWAVCLCLLDWCRGRWWSPLMFGPCVQSYIARHQSTYAVDYLFHNSGARKPLWLYEIESKGATTTFYFYSTNCDWFMKKKTYQPTPAFYRNMQWKRYFVWDKEQLNFLVRSGIDYRSANIVGPIWFSDSSKKMPKVPKKNIFIFDIPIYRQSVYAILGAPVDYYLPKNVKKFFSDIKEVSKNLGFTVVYKSKRVFQKKFSKDLHHGLYKFISNQIRNGEAISIFGNISAIKAIKKSALNISIPFTSTAIMAKNLHKPSWYYDPTGTIEKKDRNARGVPIISGKDELHKMLIQNFKRRNKQYKNKSNKLKKILKIDK